MTTPPDATRTGAGVPPPVTPLDAPPGFALDREIGSGGMGVVYLARQQGLNRPVALKTVRSGTSLDPRALIRFLAEAESMASVRHPNVVEVYSFGEHAGRPYLALEYCPGGDLTTISKAEQTRDANWFRKVADLMAKIADGVNAAHAQGIVHRDLKPANVLLTAPPGEPAASAAWFPKVTDFGLAKRGLGSDLTQTQDVLGTPAYMAPEQASGRTKFVGPEADVWALGVMLYELLSGTRPIDGANPLEVMAAVAKAEVPRVEDRFPSVPRDLALVTHKCLSADPRDRYPTAGRLANELRNWLDGKPVSARPAGMIESAAKWVKRNKRVALTGAGVLLTMATATGVSLGFGIDATEQRKQAKADAKRAEEEKQAAIEAKNDLAKANEKTELALARATVSRYMSSSPSWYGVTFSVGRDEKIAMNWELVEHRHTPFAHLLMEEAVTYRAPNATLSEDFLHSLVGLDAKQKGEFDRQLIEALRDPSLPPANRTRVAEGAARAGYCQEWPTQLVDTVRDGFQPIPIFNDPGTSLYALANCAALAPDRSDELAELAKLRFCGHRQTIYDSDDYSALLRLLSGVSSAKRASISAQILESLLTKFPNSSQYETVMLGEMIIQFAAVEFPDRATALTERVANRLLEEFNASRTAAGRVTYTSVATSSPLAARLANEFLTRLLADAETDDPASNAALQSVALLCEVLPSEKREATRQTVIESISVRLNKLKDAGERATFLNAGVQACRNTDPAWADRVLRGLLEFAQTPDDHVTLQQGFLQYGLLPATSQDATRMAEQIADEPWWSSTPGDLTHTLEALCLGLSREELHRRKAVPALAGGMVSPDALPKPKPLPPQVLVDLLKRPFVVKEKRRAVLNALEYTYDRQFKDLWEFVAFAEKEHPELDLLTPPKRPERK